MKPEYLEAFRRALHHGASRQDAALAVIEAAHAEDERDRNRRAAGWVVVSECERYGSLHVYGPYPDAGTAAAAAADMDADLEKFRDDDGTGWTVTVERLMPPDER